MAVTTPAPLPYAVAYAVVIACADRWVMQKRGKMSTRERAQFRAWRQAWYDEYSRLYGLGITRAMP